MSDLLFQFSTLSIEEDEMKRRKLQHWHQNQGYVKVVTIPVGQGDSTLIQCPGTDGDMTLIDMGADHFALSKNTYVEQVLAHTGGGVRIKHIFLTHPDKDHISHGLSTAENVGLLNKIDSDVKIYIGAKIGWQNDDSAKEILDIIGEKPKLILQQPRNLQIIHICGTSSPVKLQLLTKDKGRTKNSKSMVLKLINGQTAMLFLGDLEDSPAITNKPKMPVVQNLIDLHKKEKLDLKADVIMIPHHGSSNNGNGESNLYEVVGATSAIISSHIENTHDHPRRKTIESFCFGVPIESCDIPCGYKYSSWGTGMEYRGQADLSGEIKAAFCPDNDITAWASFKSVKPDLSGTTNYKSRNSPYQTLTCPGKRILQTTRFIEDKTNGVKVHAYIIGTYLGPEAGQVDHVSGKLINAAKGNFKPPVDTNMFDMI